MKVFFSLYSGPHWLKILGPSLYVCVCVCIYIYIYIPLPCHSLSSLSLIYFNTFLGRFNIWYPFLMITFYYQIKTLIIGENRTPNFLFDDKRLYLAPSVPYLQQIFSHLFPHLVCHFYSKFFFSSLFLGMRKPTNIHKSWVTNVAPWVFNSISLLSHLSRHCLFSLLALAVAWCYFSKQFNYLGTEFHLSPLSLKKKKKTKLN